MADNPQFNFEISLSVLDNLGRYLYRSFATVIGEAISNAWDADAKNVHIYIDKAKNTFVIKDDGVGMTAEDFQEKLLRVGYSKRKGGRKKSPKGRPFIGRKGIGKLALLSCADRISIISKVKRGTYVGGTIDNSNLDKAITDDLKPEEYPLEECDAAAFAKYTKGHSRGTIIRFEGLKEGIKANLKSLATSIALYFRFTLLDRTFNIYVEDEKIGHKHLKELVDNTEFLWKVGKIDDPLIEDIERFFKKAPRDHEVLSIRMPGITGFIASVTKPRCLKIKDLDDRVGIDLFVNGRLRERDILKHTPTQRLAESYLYGQIHFNGLDDRVDRFTSSREGIVVDDPKYKAFLDRFRKKMVKLAEEWDQLRVKHRETGDTDNDRLTPTQRASTDLFSAVSKDYLSKTSKTKTKVDAWLDELHADAVYNFGSYADCFVSENLIRKYIRDANIPLTEEAKRDIQEYKTKELGSKGRGNISIAIRKDESDELAYLDMPALANLVDKKDASKQEACLARDAQEYKPMRDAVAHTARLSDSAKTRLTTVRENIKARIAKLLSKQTES
ncbi:MAG TPA: ATP-binding protein [Fimbriimonas sp.]|nr:ATP-binding protein [Fimbriimonas sp.]